MRLESLNFKSLYVLSKHQLFLFSYIHIGNY